VEHPALPLDANVQLNWIPRNGTPTFWLRRESSWRPKWISTRNIPLGGSSGVTLAPVLGDWTICSGLVWWVLIILLRDNSLRSVMGLARKGWSLVEEDKDVMTLLMTVFFAFALLYPNQLDYIDTKYS
jgi:hypothetical protein